MHALSHPVKCMVVGRLNATFNNYMQVIENVITMVIAIIITVEVEEAVANVGSC